jgi:hypothetical protein
LSPRWNSPPPPARHRCTKSIKATASSLSLHQLVPPLCDVRLQLSFASRFLATNDVARKPSHIDLNRRSAWQDRRLQALRGPHMPLPIFHRAGSLNGTVRANSTTTSSYRQAFPSGRFPPMPFQRGPRRARTSIIPTAPRSPSLSPTRMAARRGNTLTAPWSP